MLPLRIYLTIVTLYLLTTMGLSWSSESNPVTSPKTNPTTTSFSGYSQTPVGVVNVAQKSWTYDIWPPLIAALVSGGVLLFFSTQLQKKLLHLSARLQRDWDTYFRFGERGMEAQFLLFRAVAVRKEIAHPDWTSTAQALQDKEAAVRTLSGPIHSFFSNDQEIGKLYSQFLDLYIKLKRILINHNHWDQAQFETDQDRLYDLYGEIHFRMGRIIESGNPVSMQDMYKWREATKSRREEMDQWE